MSLLWSYFTCINEIYWVNIIINIGKINIFYSNQCEAEKKWAKIQQTIYDLQLHTDPNRHLFESPSI